MVMIMHYHYQGLLLLDYEGVIRWLVASGGPDAPWRMDPAVLVRDCRLALAHGTGGQLGARHSSASLILEREA